MGRLNQFGFALLAIGLAFGHIWVYAQLKYHPDLTGWNAYTITLLVLLWMKFCIISRRMHDTGSSGFVLVPVLVVLAGLYVVIIDPETMGPSALDSDAAKFVMQHGMRLPRVLLIAIFIYCIRSPGEAGPNGYGPEFGDSDDGTKRASDMKGGNRLGNEPVHSYTRLQVPGSGPQWSERQRPKGFGRR